MDIDSHIEMFRKDMINNKTDEEKFKIEEQCRSQIQCGYPGIGFANQNELRTG